MEFPEDLVGSILQHAEAVSGVEINDRITEGVNRKEVLESAPFSDNSMVRKLTKAARDQRRQQLKRESAATEAVKIERVLSQPQAKKVASAKEAPRLKSRDRDICTKPRSRGAKGTSESFKDWDKCDK